MLILGIQTQYLWNFAKRHIEADYVSSFGLWPGKGIVCGGEELEPTDYPPNMLTQSDKDELQTGLKESETWDDVETDEESDEESAEFVSSPINLYHLAETRYQPVKKWDRWQYYRVIGLLVHLGEWGRLPALPRSRISNDLHRIEELDSRSKDQSWILRNLTTQEFVRSEAIAIKPEYIHGPDIDVLGFEEVLWSRICWSTEPDRSLNDKDSLLVRRGIWAGHRFDITTIDRNEQASAEQTQWKDVSEDVADCIDRIWRRGFGSHWRELIQQWNQWWAYSFYLL